MYILNRGQSQGRFFPSRDCAEKKRDRRLEEEPIQAEGAAAEEAQDDQRG